MDREESVDNSWQENIPKTTYQLEFKTPKELLRVIDILKQLHVSTLKISYEFKSQFDRNNFKEVFELEEKDQYCRERGQNKQPSQKKGMQRKTKNGFTFFLGNMLKSEAFLRAYRGNKLDQLQSNSNVKVHLCDRDLYIESDIPVTKDSIVHSQMMHMYKRLQIYIFYRAPILWEIVENSDQFKRQLKKIGIECFVRPGKWKHVVCYSQNLKEQQIKKQVSKLNSFERKVLTLNDSQLNQYDNIRIFDVVFKSIRSTIEKIKKIYETDIEVNKKNSSFVFHLKHEAFAKEPIEQISNVVSNLFTLSFYLRNPRSFINLVRRNSNLYPFIQVSHYNKTAYCCINRKQIKDKKEVLAVFGQFLDELEPKSKLTIHMKANSVLQQQSTIPDQILDLTDQFNLQVQDYQSIKESKNFNIVVKPKLFNKPQKKKQKKLQFSNFLLKLLMLQEVTQEQLNQSIVEAPLAELSTEGSNKSHKKPVENDKTQGAQRRGNRDRKNEKPQQLSQQKTQRGNRGKRIPNDQKLIAQKEEVQQQNSVQWENSMDEKSQILKQIDASPPLNSKQMSFEYDIQFPQDYSQGLYKKDGRDEPIQDLILKKVKIHVKAWKLKLNKGIFQIQNAKKAGLNCKKCFFVRSIQDSQNNKISLLEIVDIEDLPEKSTFFLIYKSDSPQLWIPTHQLYKC